MGVEINAMCELVLHRLILVFDAFRLVGEQKCYHAPSESIVHKFTRRAGGIMTSGEMPCQKKR